MEEAWRAAPTRPHPASPDTPPLNLIAGLPATAWDLTVGSVRLVKRLVLRR